MVNSVTQNDYLFVPREKRLISGMNHYLSFRRKCLCSSKQICHGCRSLSIAYRLYEHRSITVEVMSGPKRSKGGTHRQVNPL